MADDAEDTVQRYMEIGAGGLVGAVISLAWSYPYDCTEANASPYFQPCRNVLGLYALDVPDLGAALVGGALGGLVGLAVSWWRRR